jgi:hypothetical protein
MNFGNGGGKEKSEKYRRNGVNELNGQKFKDKEEKGRRKERFLRGGMRDKEDVGRSEGKGRWKEDE